MRSFVNHKSSIVILFLLLLACGCQKKIIAPAPPPPPDQTAPDDPVPQAVTPSIAPLPEEPPAEPPPPSETVTISDDLRQGEASFNAGDYKTASLLFLKFLAENPKSKDREQALFHLGLSRAIATDSSRDPLQAEAALRRLITEFPESGYRKQAEYMLALQAQIDKLKADVKERDEKIKLLNEELQKLKEIDLQRRPRPGE